MAPSPLPPLPRTRKLSFRKLNTRESLVSSSIFVTALLTLSHIPNAAIASGYTSGIQQENDTESNVSLDYLPLEDAAPRISLPADVASPDGSSKEEQGFASLDSMLHWAIENSDPDTLRKQALHTSRFTQEELALKRQHIKDVMDAMKMPTDAEMMSVAISDLTDPSMPVPKLLHALAELQILVEPIDNANDLVKLGGVAALEGVLSHESEQVRTAAAWVLGIAAQNNPKVQTELLDQGILQKLMLCISAVGVTEEESVKCFYALSGILRNHVAAQNLFLKTGGISLLTDILSGVQPAGGGRSSRLKKKAVFLIGALAEQSPPSGPSSSNPSWSGYTSDPLETEKEGPVSGQGLRAVEESIVLSLGASGRASGVPEEKQEVGVEEDPVPVLALGGPAVSKGSRSGEEDKGSEGASGVEGDVGKASSSSGASIPDASDVSHVSDVNMQLDTTSGTESCSRKEEGSSGVRQCTAGTPSNSHEAHESNGEGDAGGASGRQEKQEGEEGWDKSEKGIETSSEGEGVYHEQLWEPSFLKALLSLVEMPEGANEDGEDLDMLEKVLYTLRSILVSPKWLIADRDRSLADVRAKSILLSAGERLQLMRSDKRSADIQESEHDDSYIQELERLLEDVQRLI